MQTRIWIKTQYISEDGRSFPSKKLCEQHENEVKKGLPDDYEEFMNMLRIEVVKNGSSMPYAFNGRTKQTSRDIKNFVNNNNYELFWQYVSPTEENYKIIKKIHRFQQPPTPRRWGMNNMKFSYKEVFNTFYKVFLSEAWNKKNPNAAEAQIAMVEDMALKYNIKLIKS